MKSFKTNLITIFATLMAMAIFIPSANAAIIEIYTGSGAGELRADWEAAVGGFNEEDFDDGIADDFSIVSTTGFATAGISAGEYHDQIAEGETVTFTFDFVITAFGGDWDLGNPGGPGIGLTLFAGAVIVSQEIVNSVIDQFFGFTSDTAFDMLVISHGTQAIGVETFDLDNVVYNNVPEPATILLFLSGIIGFGLRRRVRM